MKYLRHRSLAAAAQSSVLLRSVLERLTFPEISELGGHAREDALHKSDRTHRTWQRILAVDLIFQVHVSLVTGLLKLPEDRRDRHHAVTHLTLTVLVRLIPEILEMHVQQPRTGVDDLLNDICSAAHRVPDVHAQAHTRVHSLHRVQNYFRRGKILVLRPVGVD